jgi:preprotein translocase subunit SecG
MTSTLMIAQIILSILLTVTILLQKSDSIGLGAYSGSNESLFGAKGPSGFLAKATFTLALLFVINTLALGYLYNKESSHSVTDTLSKQRASVPAPTPAPKSAPQAPAAPTEKTSK